MPEADYDIGEHFPVQFAWKLPNGDYLRAVFRADVLDLVTATDKYIVRLSELVAGRQESGDGQRRPTEELSEEYWGLVGQIVGKRISLAFEADDGRTLHLRLATLTGEHSFFTRFDDAVQMLRRQRPSAKDSSP
jgi:hypothetical protein